jgi:hypothetical protein
MKEYTLETYLQMDDNTKIDHKEIHFEALD